MIFSIYSDMKRQEAIQLLEDTELSSINFINTLDSEEFLDTFSFKDLIDRHEGSTSLGKVYSELNLFFNNLSLFALDSFLSEFNKKRADLVMIAHSAYDRQNNEGIEYTIISECGGLLELVRDQTFTLIQDQENKKIKPYILTQLDTLNKEENIFGDDELDKYASFFFETIKTLFSFNKKTPTELSRFSLQKADPKIIRKQMLQVIEQNII